MERIGQELSNCVGVFHSAGALATLGSSTTASVLGESLLLTICA